MRFEACAAREFRYVSPRVGPWRSLVSASVWGAEGREFESRRPDHQRNRPLGSVPCGRFLIKTAGELT